MGKPVLRTEQYYVKLDAIVQLLLEKHEWLAVRRTRELRDQVMKTLGVGERMADNYIADARKIIKQHASVTSKQAVEDMLLDLQHLRVQAKKNKNHKLLLDVLKQQALIYGLNRQSLNVQGDIKSEITIKFEE